MKKIAFVTTTFSPYKIALFNKVMELSADEVKFFIMARNEKIRDWDLDRYKIRFDYHIFKKLSFNSTDSRGYYLNYGVIRVLRKFKPDIIVNNNYGKPANILSFLYSLVFGVKFIIMEEYHIAYYKNNLYSRLWRFIMQKFAYKFIACHFPAYLYLKSNGVKDDRIVLTNETVDVEHFDNRAAEFKRTSQYHHLIAEYGEKVILYIGQFIKRKNVEIILESMNDLENQDGYCLLLIGAGPLQSKYENYIKKYDLGNSVKILGFKEQDDIIKYLAIAKVLVLPSIFEIWGLVVNEALVTGTIPIVSRTCASSTLIIDEHNGRKFAPHDVKALRNCIVQVIDNYPIYYENIKDSKTLLSLDRYAKAVISSYNE